MEFNIIKKISRGKLFGKEQEICDMYFNQKKTLVEVAEHFRCDSKFIRVLFKNNNLKPRSTKGMTQHKNIIGNEEDIKTLYLSGLASKDIAEKYSVDLGTILNCLRFNNVKIRTASEARTTDRVIESDKLRRIKFSENDTKIIINNYIDGYSATELGDMFGCDLAVIKRIVLENGIKFRGTDSMFTDRVKDKAKTTLHKRFGSWKERNIYLNKKFQEKYGDGITGAMQVSKFFHKNQNSGIRIKNSIVDGVKIYYRGYELKGIYRLLEEGYNINELVIGKGVPTIRYNFDGRDNRVYYPDIYIPKDNRLIEVKSKWTFDQHKNKNLAKRDAATNAGYNFDFYIMDKHDRG
jgi:hypothetical protein